MDYYENLLAKKEELEELIKQKRENFRIPLAEATDELSMYDQHPADIASEVYEREKDAGFLELLELELEKLNDAMSRYHSGKYGICENCGHEIEKERLERLINTTLCVNCAREYEKRHPKKYEVQPVLPGTTSDLGEGLEIAGYEYDES